MREKFHYAHYSHIYITMLDFSTATHLSLSLEDCVYHISFVIWVLVQDEVFALVRVILISDVDGIFHDDSSTSLSRRLCISQVFRSYVSWFKMIFLWLREVLSSTTSVEHMEISWVAFKHIKSHSEIFTYVYCCCRRERPRFWFMQSVLLHRFDIIYSLLRSL